MKTITAAELRANMDKLLDEVLRTGLPVEIKKGNRRLRLVPVGKDDKFQNLVLRPEVIQGDPDDLVAISWEEEVTLDLP